LQVLCISFKAADQTVNHKLVYFCMIPSDIVDADSQPPSKYSDWVRRWKRYKGYITTDPQPWKIDDPEILVREKKMWPSLNHLLQSRPELSILIEVIDRASGSLADTSLNFIPPAVVEVSKRAAALELKYRNIQASSSHSGPGPLSSVPFSLDGSVPWQGAAEAAPLFKVLVDFNYRLPTAIAAVAPRFGTELPALTRMLIEHRQLPGLPLPPIFAPRPRIISPPPLWHRAALPDHRRDRNCRA
jgi:hypothetical protein